MCLRIIALIICLSAYSFAQTDSQDYLSSVVAPLPTNGSKIRTPQPLAPYTSYRIKITSPYNLKPVYTESQGDYETDIQVDGRTIRAFAFDEGSDGHLGSVEFLYHGHGKPIYIGFGRDHHVDIESAQIHIYAEGKLQKVWREGFSRTWRAYGDWIVTFLIIIPLMALIGIFFNKRSQRIKDEERMAEKERQALILNSHNKSLELMREIERRAQQKAHELMARNYDEIQRKVMYWRSRAYTESYFLSPDLRQNFAAANRDKIINELEKKWAQEFLEIAQDLKLAEALREQEPGVMQWIQARQEVINLAHKLSWTTHPVIDAHYEEMSGDAQIITAEEFEEAENAARGRVH